MYEQFRRYFSSYPIISTKEIMRIIPNFDAKNLVYWQKKGYIQKLRNGFYVFNDTEWSEERLYRIANTLYSPSYISLESAFQFYNFIPEGVFSFHSVSTLKTNRFTTDIGTFQYKTIKRSLFFGYKLIEMNGIRFRMATLEKAILDYLYLNPHINDLEHLRSLRWSKPELASLNQAKLKDYQSLYNSPTINRKIELLKQYLDD
ncbi:MAG: hypothetical protein JJU02_06495 [Cryomorphaceae bacterium]|nr:hypothetical protein [Cryomorphaceae bacterium]